MCSSQIVIESKTCLMESAYLKQIVLCYLSIWHVKILIMNRRKSCKQERQIISPYP